MSDSRTTPATRRDRLTVVVYRDEDEEDEVWYAQGLELNYLAEGSSIEDVKRTFEIGLAATIEANLERFQTFEMLWKSAPLDVVARVLSRGVRGHYPQVTTHVFPFALAYLDAA